MAQPNQANQKNLTKKYNRKPISGCGIGLRSCHYTYIKNNKPNVSWFEVLSDNYMVQGGSALRNLELIRQNYPITLHGTGLSLGSVDPVNMDYLKKLKFLNTNYQASMISDHLSWSSYNNISLPDLFPLPYTEEAINHVVNRINYIQDYLGQQILIENVSTYLSFNDSIMPEYEFINTIAKKADCFILLDLNNIYVSAINNGFAPKEYLQSLDSNRIKQYHLAGHSDFEDYLLDTHSNFVTEDVWNIYKSALKFLGDKPVLFEWDNDIPEFSVLESEAYKANKILQHYNEHLTRNVNESSQTSA